jgi:hypothetical protein
MSGFMMAHLGHTTMIHAAAWMPLLIWALDRLSDRLSAWWFVMGTGAVTCSILAGHPQIALYAIGLSTAYAFLLGWTTPVGRWKYYGISLAVIVLGIFLAAIQIVPTAELSGLGLRATMTFRSLLTIPYHPSKFLNLFFLIYLVEEDLSSDFKNLPTSVLGTSPKSLAILGYSHPY